MRQRIQEFKNSRIQEFKNSRIQEFFSARKGAQCFFIFVSCPCEGGWFGNERHAHAVFLGRTPCFLGACNRHRFREREEEEVEEEEREEENRRKKRRKVYLELTQ